MTGDVCISLTLKDIRIKLASFEVLGGVHLEVLHRKARRQERSRKRWHQEWLGERPPYMLTPDKHCGPELWYTSAHGLEHGGTMRGASASLVGRSTWSICGRLPVLRSTQERRLSRYLADQPRLDTREKSQDTSRDFARVKGEAY